MALAQFAPPPQIIANFTELEKIESISKYRSCAGHTTVPQDEREMKRSMKHYFRIKSEHLGADTIAIYSPYDGFVIRERDMDCAISVQHINIREGLKRGSEIKVGELIGYGAVSPDADRNTFDVVYGKGALVPKIIDNWMGPFTDLDPIFNQMSDNVFAHYREKGISSKNEIIISKETRDQNPCTYTDNGPYFLWLPLYDEIRTHFEQNLDVE